METRRQLTTSDGARLAYWLTASADAERPLLLLLHGAASNHTRWSEMLENTHLTSSWDVLRPDLRGNGASMIRGRFDLEIWSRDLVELLDAEGREQALVAGHSLGAQIALEFAHQFPERTLGLVLLDPIHRRALTGKQGLLSRLGPLWALLVWIARGLNALGIRRRTIDAERDLRQLDERTREALRDGESYREIARRYTALGPILRHMPVANYLQQMRAMMAPLPPLESIAVPALVLLSAGITFSDLEVARAESERLPNTEIVTIDANHWPLTERPDEVRRAIEEWVTATFPPEGPTELESLSRAGQ